MFFLYRVRCIHPDGERGPYSAANYHLRRYKAFSYNERILERRDTAWMKLVRTHKLFDSSVFAADFRLLRDQSGQYLLDHTSGRCDHFTCSEIPIMQALMSSKSCLIVAESRGIGELLNFCVAGVFVHSDDAIGYRSLHTHKLEQNDLEYRNSTEIVTFRSCKDEWTSSPTGNTRRRPNPTRFRTTDSSPLLWATEQLPSHSVCRCVITMSSFSTVPFSSLCYNAYPTFIEYNAFTQAMSLLKDDQIVVLRGVNLAKNRGLLEGVLRLGLQVT